MKQRPDVMIYFSIRPSLKRLNLEQKGSLFEAILDYGQTGVVPEFDGVLGIAWDFIQPLIDADGEAYRDKCEKAKKAIETRWAKAKENTNEYDCIRTYTDHTNYNNNTNNNYNSIPISKSITMGECEGDELNCIVRSLDGPESIDFERERSRKLAEFTQWANKQEKS